MDNKTEEESETRIILCPYCQGVLSVSIHCMSLLCRHCKRHINIEEDLAQTESTRKYPVGTRRLACFKCGKEIFIDKNSQAVTCKYCYHNNDLSDYKIKKILGKKIETHGTLYLKKRGKIEISDVQVGDAIIKGIVQGDIKALGTVEIMKRGEIHGKITCSKLIVYKGGIFEGSVHMLNARPIDY